MSLVGLEIQELRYSERGIQLKFRVPDSVLYFEGHFPGFPILPGIVQIDWAIALARSYLAPHVGPVHTIQVKFRKAIRPNSVVAASLSLAADGRRLDVVYRDNKGPYVTARIGF